MSPLARAIAILLVVFVAGCEATPAAPSATRTAGSAQWAKRTHQFEEGYFALNPPFAVQEGRHDYDGRLPDWSSAGIRSAVQWLHAQRTQAEAFDQNLLSAQQRFERQYLLSEIDANLFWLEDAEQPFTNTRLSI